MRENLFHLKLCPADDIPPAPRAMVEENVEINVQRLAQDSSVQHVRPHLVFQPHPPRSSPGCGLQAWYLYKQQTPTQAAEQPTAPTRRSEDEKQAELW